MEDKLDKLKKFFDYNLKIKKVLYDIAPNVMMDGYNVDYSIAYADQLYYALEDIEYYITSIANLFLNSDYQKYVKALFAVFKDELIKCGSDFNKLRLFYINHFSNMNPELINEVRETCVGYTLFNSGFSLIKKTKTINELLHVMHAAIVNNENNYCDVPVLQKKQNDSGNYINLLGVQSEVAQKIFDFFPLGVYSCQADIMSFGNKVLLMIRDLGHALSIEIDVEGEMCVVRYFIPKVCNYLMVNKLRGITPVKPNSKYAVGQFVISSSEIANAISQFVLNVPTDDHMFIEGGLCYCAQNNNKKK